MSFGGHVVYLLFSFSSLIFHNHSHTVKRRQSISPFIHFRGSTWRFLQTLSKCRERWRIERGWMGQNKRHRDLRRGCGSLHLLSPSKPEVQAQVRSCRSFLCRLNLLHPIFCLAAFIFLPPSFSFFPIPCCLHAFLSTFYIHSFTSLRSLLFLSCIPLLYSLTSILLQRWGQASAIW